jgi:predicted amino acid racemase
MSSDPPDEKHLCYAVRQLNCMKAFYPHADISFGGTDVLELTAKFSLPESIREIRCGTGIMLGVYPLSGKNIPAARQDTFRLETHVLECRKKQGRMRALLDMGSYHTAPDKLIPALPGITLAGVSSAYTSLDITECPLRIREGDILTFHLRYEALARSLCSRALPLILEDYKEETAHG